MFKRISKFFGDIFHHEPNIIKVEVSDHTENSESGKYWVRDSEGCYVAPETTEDWVAIFITAKNRKDGDMMYKALQKAKKCCPESNDDCLREIFCPECPNSGFEVIPNKPEPLKITFYD